MSLSALLQTSPITFPLCVKLRIKTILLTAAFKALSDLVSLWSGIWGPLPRQYPSLTPLLLSRRTLATHLSLLFLRQTRLPAPQGVCTCHSLGMESRYTHDHLFLTVRVLRKAFLTTSLKGSEGTSLAVQSLRFYPPTSGGWVRSLVEAIRCHLMCWWPKIIFFRFLIKKAPMNPLHSLCFVFLHSIYRSQNLFLHCLFIVCVPDLVGSWEQSLLCLAFCSNFCVMNSAWQTTTQ